MKHMRGLRAHILFMRYRLGDIQPQYSYLDGIGVCIVIYIYIYELCMLAK